jgi:hypothetical protein
MLWKGIDPVEGGYFLGVVRDKQQRVSLAYSYMAELRLNRGHP